MEKLNEERRVGAGAVALASICSLRCRHPIGVLAFPLPIPFPACGLGKPEALVPCTPMGDLDAAPDISLRSLGHRNHLGSEQVALCLSLSVTLRNKEI